MCFGGRADSDYTRTTGSGDPSWLAIRGEFAGRRENGPWAFGPLNPSLLPLKL